MFSAPLKKKITDHFKTPLRHKDVARHAADIIENTRYKIIPSFLKELKSTGLLNADTFTAKNKKKVTLYASIPMNEADPYDVALAICPNGYFCNLSSIFYHCLTNQIPSSIYICNETIRPRQKPRTEELTDTKIRNAFIKPHRHTNYVFAFNNYEIIVVDREKNTRHGVKPVSLSNAPLPIKACVTSIERALIDAVVSPQYNGGITSVYSYFKTAKQKKINTQKLLEIYQALNFTYPYCQTIGFFFDKLGMAKQATAVYDALPPKQKFYVDRNAKTTWQYDDKWKLYYPKALVDED